MGIQVSVSMFTSPWLTACLLSWLQVAHAVDSFSPTVLEFVRFADSPLTAGSPLAVRVEPAVAGEIAMVILHLVPNMVLFKGDVIKVVLPGFTGCGLPSLKAAYCELESAVGGMETGLPRAKMFSASWSAAEQSIKLTLLQASSAPRAIR